MPTLYVLRHATTGETRKAFPSSCGREGEDGGVELDLPGHRAARSLAEHLPRADVVWSSWATRAVQTATLAAREPDTQTDDLAEASFGEWEGRTVADVDAETPDVLRGWMADADATPPGGEAFGDVKQRARRVLDRAASVDGTVVAVSHGGFIRALVTEVLGAPSRAAWGLQLAPASVTMLTGDGDPDHWQLTVVGWRPTLPEALG
ncbi:Phosphoglycerate mutase [Euzebya pacifica]|uniref:Phosphoglycerate mutase n=1 Tax=Euzebya pacifica TaxID=1608957 RepID=A0A346XYI2_9ACTN|nr:histidine phosphatase family protein [Euzebya pacifica]AXV07279.1 Phosphoglycerate mutase [Euzebya pacifica]